MSSENPTDPKAKDTGAENTPQNEPEQKNAGSDLDNLKAILREVVNEAINEKKVTKEAQEVQDYNNKIAKAVSTAQSNLIRPTIDDGSKHVDYVKKVIADDTRRRLQDSEGKSRYSESDPVEFTKAKILILKKMGLTEEEIAREMKDYL